MKVLIVASYNSGRFVPFILDQVEAIKKEGVIVDFFGITGKGILGYLKMLPKLKKKIRNFKPDIIHAHYGLSGLFANLQRKIPVVTTYHGSDINNKKVLFFSKLAMKFSVYNIFVSQKNIDIAKIKQKYQLVPCGVDLDMFYPIDKKEARDKMNLEDKKKYVLFSSHFNNQVKNPQLAIESVALCHDDVELLELKGYSRSEVNILMNAVDCVLMTSHTEGSPQFIKEAMAVNCPIVSVDVGDVSERLEECYGSMIVESNPFELSSALSKVFSVKLSQVDMRSKISTVSNSVISNIIIDIYKSIQ